MANFTQEQFDTFMEAVRGANNQGGGAGGAKLDTFTSSSSHEWLMAKKHFQSVAAARGWDVQNCKLQLRAMFKGEAMMMVADIDFRDGNGTLARDNAYTMEQVLAAIDEQFLTGRGTAAAHNELENLEQRDTENIQSYAARCIQTHTRALPDHANRQGDRILINRFLKGLKNKVIRQALMFTGNEHATLNLAVQAAIRADGNHEFLEMEEKRRGGIASISAPLPGPSGPPGPPGPPAVAAMAGSDGLCYLCNGTHGWRDCPIGQKFLELQARFANNRRGGFRGRGAGRGNSFRGARGGGIGGGRGNPAQRGGWRGRNRGSPRFNPKDIRAVASLLADTSDKAEPAPSTSSGKKKEGAAADSAASAASAAKRILAVIAAESEGYEHGEDPEPYSGQEGPDDYYHPGDDPYPADQGGMFWPGDDSHDPLFH